MIHQLRSETKQVPAGKQVARNPSCGARYAIRWFVADQETSAVIDRPAPEKIDYHPRSRLAPVANSAVLGNRPRWVEGAIAALSARVACGLAINPLKNLSREVHRGVAPSHPVLDSDEGGFQTLSHVPGGESRHILFQADEQGE